MPVHNDFFEAQMTTSMEKSLKPPTKGEQRTMLPKPTKFFTATEHWSRLSLSLQAPLPATYSYSEVKTTAGEWRKIKAQKPDELRKSTSSRRSLKRWPEYAHTWRASMQGVLSSRQPADEDAG